MLRSAQSISSLRTLLTPVLPALHLASRRALTYKAPTADILFNLNELHNVLPKYAKILPDPEAVNAEMIESIVHECARLSETTLFPLYESGDREGCTLKDTNVTTPKGFQGAWQEVAKGGWQALSIPAEYGGQGLPMSLNLVKMELMSTANWSFQMYPGLTSGAANTLLLHGSEEQKKMCLPKFADGSWLGTMCLTEPHCGTDLGLMKTKAEPTATEGTFKLNGTKIFISSGEHDLGENIIHIVLAKLPGAPEGTKGISLFLVPKYIQKADGTLETKKNIICTGIEKKMGIKASSTCQMTFENSIGYLIGKPNEGLKYMFTFMNGARIGTALQGVAHAELSYQNSVAYAKERIAMRSLTGAKSPDKPADPIIVHPDVRRLLLFQRAIAEGGRALVMECAVRSDILMYVKTEEERKKYDSELGFFTPIAKGFLTEVGFEAANAGLQVWGGHGYVQGNGMEQIVRDARIAMLYEGTTGVQALDLMARKVVLNKFSLLNKFTGEMKKALPSFFASAPLGSMSRTLWRYLQRWRFNSMRIGLMATKNKDIIGTASLDYLMYAGYITLAHYWLQMAKIAHEKIQQNLDVNDFYLTKIQTAEFYFERILPRADGHEKAMLQDPRTIMQMKAEQF